MARAELASAKNGWPRPHPPTTRNLAIRRGCLDRGETGGADEQSTQNPKTLSQSCWRQLGQAEPPSPYWNLMVTGGGRSSGEANEGTGSARGVRASRRVPTNNSASPASNTKSKDHGDVAAQLAGLVSALQLQVAAMSAQMQAMQMEMGLEAPLPAPRQPDMEMGGLCHDGQYQSDTDSGDDTGDDVAHTKEKLRKMKEKLKQQRRGSAAIAVHPTIAK